jgi:solute carrier family 15 (peptide/histidine transporter), member 3/4
VNLVVYFLTVMHMDLAEAANLLTNYMGTSYMVAVLISVFADTFVGRYKTDHFMPDRARGTHTIFPPST